MYGQHQLDKLQLDIRYMRFTKRLTRSLRWVQAYQQQAA